MNALINISEQQLTKDKTTLIRNFARQLNMIEAEPSKDLKKLGNKIIKKFPEFHFINEYGIKIGYVLSHERKNGEKITYAECRKVNETYKAYLPFDFVITFYECNTGYMSENQKQVLMLHELKHIGVGPRGLKIIQHDVEDFKDILSKYGLNWDSFNNNEIPDILAGDEHE
jgi:hypothetical protein